MQRDKTHIPSSRARLIVLVLGAFALRLAYCAATTGLGRALPHEQYREYIIAGQRLAEQGTLVSPLIPEDYGAAPSVLMPPAYAIFVAVVYRILGTETFAATIVLQVINAAATSLAVAFVFSIARRLGGRWTAWAAGGIAAVNPMLFGFTTYMWDTSLFCLGITVSIWISLRLSERRTGLWAWGGYGFFLGALALLNPSLTIAYPLLVLWPLSRRYGRRLGPMVRPVALTVVGWLIAITPWTVRNYIQFDTLLYVRGGFMLELWLGVCPEADAHGAAVYRRQFPLLNAEVQRQVASTGEQAYLEECGERARAAIVADPWRFARLVAIRVVDYWAGTVFSHAGPGGSGWPRSTMRAAVTIFLLTEVGVIAVCLLVPGKLDADLRWLLAIVILFSLVYCLTHVQVRFRAPTEPIIAILVAVLPARTLGRRLRGRWPSPSD